MASSQPEISLARRTRYFTDSDSDSQSEEEERGQEEEEDDGDEDEEEELERKNECKNLVFNAICGGGRGRGRDRGGVGWSLGQILDPRARWVQEWNRVFLLVCAAGLFVDPLFFYALSISDTCMCLYVDGWFAITVTALRCMTDALHVWNMWLQLKMAKKPSFYGVGGRGGDGNGGGGDGEDRRGGTHFGTTPRSVALKYLKAKKGFFFDLFVVLPLPQV